MVSKGVIEPCKLNVFGKKTIKDFTRTKNYFFLGSINMIRTKMKALPYNLTNLNCLIIYEIVLTFP